MLGKLLFLLGYLTVWAQAKYNIIFIFTDDQDVRLQSLQYMTKLQNLMISQGAQYQHHYCTVALCCPSRVNLLTGRAAHNTNVTDIRPPYGGYPQFIANGLNDDWLPIWMQKAGYNTYYVGKLMNYYNEDNYLTPEPVHGFNGSDFLIGGGTYNYYNPTFQRNIGNTHQAPKTYKQNYTTTLTFQKGMAFLDDARKAGGPFFLTMAPVACHAGHGVSPNSPDQNPPGPVPEVKYASMFKNIGVPQSANYNKKSGSSWLLDIPTLNQAQLNTADEYYRNRIRALQSVDDLVQGTFDYLDKYNLTKNTYVIYSGDNGFHIANHRLMPGKRCPYEEDLNVPLIIRGPGVTPNSKVGVATSHTDLAPTILRMAGAPLPAYLDGTAVPQISPDVVDQNFEHVQVEHWGDAGDDEDHDYPGVASAMNNTYKGLRIIGEDYSFMYTVWCSNQHELYDMSSDLAQINNLYVPYTYKPNEPQSASNPFPINRLESRLDALLLVLQSCKADTCKRPWYHLHPAMDVSTLKDAMNPKYDAFYEKQQNRVSFERCTKGYKPQYEGPQSFKSYQSDMARRGLDYVGKIH